MTKAERRGAERMLKEIVQGFQTAGQALNAEAARRLGKRILDRDDEGCVFPAAAELTELGSQPTVRSGA